MDPGKRMCTRVTKKLENRQSVEYFIDLFSLNEEIRFLVLVIIYG